MGNSNASGSIPAYKDTVKRKARQSWFGARAAHRKLMILSRGKGEVVT